MCRATATSLLPRASALPIDAQLLQFLQGILFNKGDSLYRADFIFVLVLDSFSHINKPASRNNFFVRACVMSLWFRKRVHPRESCVLPGSGAAHRSPEDILKSARWSGSALPGRRRVKTSSLPGCRRDTALGTWLPCEWTLGRALGPAPALQAVSVPTGGRGAGGGSAPRRSGRSPAQLCPEGGAPWQEAQAPPVSEVALHPSPMCTHTRIPHV